jgi:hypothetical protein
VGKHCATAAGRLPLLPLACAAAAAPPPPASARGRFALELLHGHHIGRESPVRGCSDLVMRALVCAERRDAAVARELSQA